MNLFKIKLIIFIVILLSSCSSIEIIEDSVETALNKDISLIQISDLHINKDKKIYKRLAQVINENRPDILLITGDSIDNSDNIELLNSFLEMINSGIKKVAVLGNWEHWSKLDIQTLQQIYNNNGVELLINSSTTFDIAKQSVYIYGTDDYTGGSANMDNYMFLKDGLNIILTHSPAYYDQICKKNDTYQFFVFSGHTHGGQVTFFGTPLFTPKGSGNYLKGIYSKNNSKLYVSKGIGNSTYDIRLFAKPDIIKVTFK